jgi:hypothetical protein
MVKKNHQQWGLGVDRAVEAGAGVAAGMWSRVQARCLVLVPVLRLHSASHESYAHVWQARGQVSDGNYNGGGRGR